jgi:uncharacterized phage-associated protein
VWNERPLFKEPIFAWANGPVVKELYKQHKGQFSVPKIPHGHPSNLSAKQKDAIDRVLGAYGDKPAQSFYETLGFKKLIAHPVLSKQSTYFHYVMSKSH